jgi:hypothetical protein
MEKEEKKLKFLYTTNYIHKQLIENEELLRTGLYSWISVFDGDVKRFQDLEPSDYEKYDVIHVNMSAQDLHIPQTIRDHIGPNSKTKIVCNNDYTCELWGASFDAPLAWKHYYDAADMIFGTEPYQVGALEILLNRKVHLITHPCFVKRLKTLSVPKVQNQIAVMAHRYDMNIVTPSIAVSNIPGYKTVLIGYEQGADKRGYVTQCCYNTILSGTNYMDFCNQLMESKVVVDPFTLTSQSRTGWDCAAMGVPMVGSDRNHSARICFPKTSCDPFDIKKIRELTLKLLNDEAFRKEVIDYAKNAVEIVNYENSKANYLKALEEGSPKLT